MKLYLERERERFFFFFFFFLLELRVPFKELEFIELEFHLNFFHELKFQNFFILIFNLL